MNIVDLIAQIKASNANGLRLRATDDMRACIAANTNTVHIERDFTDYVHIGGVVAHVWQRSTLQSTSDFPDYEGMILDRQERAMMDY